MKLLITTQALDLDDPVLSAYHGWVVALAQHFEHVEVICLKLGRHDLPGNVRVHSLGKEHSAASSAAYAARFLAVAWQLRHHYDAVFVHMNQEYILIAGWLWKFLGKPIYMWRNHYAGSFATDVAAAFCTHTFCTSTHSYTAKFKKNILMPVGVNLARFDHISSVVRKPRSILFFARLMPSKRPEMFLEALDIMQKKGINFTATLCGSPPKDDESYSDILKQQSQKYGLTNVLFMPGIPNDKAPELYASHDIFINCSPSGMYDKTLFEAAASGCLVIAASDDWNRRTGDAPFASASELGERLEAVLSLTQEEMSKQRAKLKGVAHSEGLEELAASLAMRMNGQKS